MLSANIFSQFLAYLFILFVLFKKQMLFIFKSIYLFILAVPVLSCSTLDLRGSLFGMQTLICGIWDPVS